MYSIINGGKTPSEITLGERPRCPRCKTQFVHPLYDGLCEDCSNDVHAADSPAICYRDKPKTIRGDKE